jgi:hypothetical protein
MPEIVQVCSVFCQILPKEKRFTYDAALKNILYAEKTRSRAAGRKFTVN